MKKIKFKKVDTWSLYYTLAPVILKGLKKFRKSSRRKKGELKAVNDEKFDDPIKAIQKVESRVSVPPASISKTALEAGSLDPIPDAVLEAEKAYQERVQKGLDLFARNYRELWG